MFERFTERARNVVALAQEEARALRHNYIGTEHILLGLLREDEGLAARVLESLEITLDRVRDLVTRIVGSGEEAVSGQIPFTPRAKKVFELSLRESLSLGHNYIGTEHILLGLVRENEGVAVRILLDFDADPEKIRREVLRMLAGRSGRGRPLGAVHSPPTRHPLRPPLDWDQAGLLWRPDRVLRKAARLATRLMEAQLGVRLVRMPARNDARTATPAGRPAPTRPPLDPQARRAIEVAKHEALQVGGDHAGTGHLLLGVLLAGDSLAVQALTQLGVTAERVHTQVEALDRSGSARTIGEIRLTGEAQRAIERASPEARRTRSASVGPEHLLLSLVAAQEGDAAQILRALDADPLTVRSEVSRRLRPGAPHPLRPAPPGLDWRHATLLWRPEGLELRVPLRMSIAEMATFAADPIWTQPPLLGLRREIWTGWLAIASPTLLDEITDPDALRQTVDAAVHRALDATRGSGTQAADFLGRLRADP